MHALLDRLHTHMPPNMTPAEIEAEITAARDEVKQEATRRTPKNDVLVPLNPSSRHASRAIEGSDDR